VMTDAVIVPLFTHFIPILFFVYMALDVWMRNRRRIEHWLASGIIVCCAMMFLEEYVRHQLPIAYSPQISVIWFSTAGISITGFGMHLFVKLSRLEHKMPKYVYPYIFYAPIAIVIVNLMFNDQMISGNEFHQAGIWKLPVYNAAYYIAMIGSNVFNAIYIWILSVGKARASSQDHRSMYNQLILGVVVSAVFNLGIGLIDFKGALPPYPYIYGGLAWCLLLRHTMKKYDFLIHSDKRYEKLFDLNPAAILLTDMQGRVKDANPSAKQLFGFPELAQIDVFSMLSEPILARIRAREPIGNCEMALTIGSDRMDVVMDGDYVLVEYEPLLILIVRDVTVEHATQREIAYLAYHDALTHLPNRRHFYYRLEEAIQAAAEQKRLLATVLIDLDRFKEINDKYGHQAGDEVLQLAAGIIREKVGQSGVAARLGGDEFVFFLYPAPSKQAVQDVMDELRLAFSQIELVRDGHSIPIGMSIGAGFYPDDGLDGDALLNHADKAMYQAKALRRKERNAAAADVRGMGPD